MDTGALSNAVLLITTLLGMYLAALWLALIIWTYRDHRSRSRDGLISAAAALVVAVLFIPGLVIYLLLRPRETLTQAYERSLEEEALLQEIEEKPICAGCGRPTREDWQVCPHCHTTLRKVCISCRRLLELAWNQCPYCAAVQPGLTAAGASSTAAGRQRRAEQAADSDAAASSRRSQLPEVPLEFVDGDPYQT